MREKIAGQHDPNRHLSQISLVAFLVIIHIADSLLFARRPTNTEVPRSPGSYRHKFDSIAYRSEESASLRGILLPALLESISWHAGNDYCDIDDGAVTSADISSVTYYHGEERDNEAARQIYGKTRRSLFFPLQSVLTGLVWYRLVPIAAAVADAAEILPDQGSIIGAEKACRDGAIVAEESIPGAYQQVCMTLPERNFTLKTTGHTISIQQAASAKSTTSVAGRTGVTIWNSSLLLTRLLDRLAFSTTRQTSDRKDGRGGNFWTNKTVLELGCGSGLTSIAVAKLGEASCGVDANERCAADDSSKSLRKDGFSVWATDGNEEVLQLTRGNIARNRVANSVRPVQLQWGLLNAMDYSEDVDVVLGSDLTYNAGSWRLLAETVSTVLKPDGVFIYLTCGHAGFNLQSELGGFISVAQNEGLFVLDENDESWPWWKRTGRGDGREALLLSDMLEDAISPKEQSVINATGGAKVVVFRKKI